MLCDHADINHLLAKLLIFEEVNGILDDGILAFTSMLPVSSSQTSEQLNVEHTKSLFYSQVKIHSKVKIKIPHSLLRSAQ